jgi:serine/threonine-protein kinase
LAAILGAERFLKEIEVTANLQHPHILPLFDSGEADSFLYYVMPYVEGESLRDKLNREKQLAVEETIQITEQVAAALEYAHQHDVIHRDIKPENILLEAGQAVVADFGIALAVTAAGGTRLTETGLSLGTPQYMSPEQATGDRKVTARSDVYSLGAVVYEMLVGDPPHTGSSVQAIIAKVVSAEPQAISLLRHAVPANVEAAVQCALAKVPADRFATGTQFAEALTNPAFALPTTAGMAMATGTAGGWRQRLAVPLAVIAAMLLVTTVWSWLRPRPESPKSVARFGIAVPEDQAVMGRLALSPDGSTFTYVGPGASGTQLWIKRGTEHRATPLAGTDGAVAPFFSPDGAWVGFIMDGRVKKIAVVGGAATTVADSVRIQGSSYGAAWLGDGSIVFVGAGHDLLRVPEVGGQPERVVPTGRGSEVEFATHVSSLPDARGVLFTTCSRACQQSAVWALDVRSGAIRFLVEGGMGAWYAPSGHVLYGDRNGNVLAAPFDVKTVELRGAGVPVLEGVAGRYPALALSGSGDLLYVEGEGGVDPVLSVEWVERDGTARVIDPSWKDMFESVALSPDGTRLAATVGREFDTDLWIKRLDRGPASRLTFTEGLNRRATWSEDGQSVMFVSDRRANRDLYVKRADGVGAAERVLDIAAHVDQAIRSPDGKWIIYRTGIAGGAGRDIFARRLGPDSTTVPVAADPGFDEQAPALSPDGRWLAVRPFPKIEAGRWQVSVRGGTEPVWAHSGRELFYRSGDEDLMVTDVVTAPTFKPGQPRVLFSLRGYYRSVNHAHYDITADDQRFVMIRTTGLGRTVTGDLILVENFLEELKAKVGN